MAASTQAQDLRPMHPAPAVQAADGVGARPALHRFGPLLGPVVLGQSLRIPGAVAQAIKDADTFFGVELPQLTQWTFGAEHAAAITPPVLSMLGSDTAPLWVEVAEFLRTSVPDVEERTISGVGHLLHIQRSEPVAEAIAEFLQRHPLAVG
jgi:pimeloyl-ACP methyl ester carboxylesterase